MVLYSPSARRRGIGLRRDARHHFAAVHVGHPLSPRAKRSGPGWVDLCPAHPDHNHSLSIGVVRAGQLILKCFAGCAFEDILAAAGLKKGVKPVLSVPQLAHHRVAEEISHRERVRAAVRIWRSSGKIAGTVAEQYLLRRGLTQWSEDQRFHPHLFHSPSNGYRGALVSPVVRDDLHRVFLDGEGNKLDKMMLGDCCGGAVRLFGSGTRLIVAEGVETTIALKLASVAIEEAFWSAMSASGMASLQLPVTAGELIVAPDGDKAGRDAAEALAQRGMRAGWKVSILPAPEGKDWNDVLLEESRRAC
ncbi:toprim domain-containing protein [Cereibacter sphaeroides]|uniref:toprim domain-containing protein n=1 Tax=Cereibacter sphaeroides TaxID=1063 RepID=UPI00140F80C9|nr:toprim domain-containing protein [Cereibacter sphaeroides]